MIKLINSRQIFSTSGKMWLDHEMKFAQSPQTLILDEKIRIYFSTRREEVDGKFLSYISYAEFDRDFNLLRHSDQSVIDLGKLGTFDEHGVFPLNIFSEPERLLGYIGGWNRKKSVSVDGAIGIAISYDQGETFSRIGDGPVLDASFGEPFLVGDPFVRKIKEIYYMWYIHGTNWIEDPVTKIPERVYKINFAKSKDGITWEKDVSPKQLIPDVLGEFEAQAMPTVIEIDNEFLLFYCYRDIFDFRSNKAKGYKIGCASSKNLEEWQIEDVTSPSIGQDGFWDSDMQCYPHVFAWQGKNYIAYNGNKFGREGFGVAEISVEPKNI